MSSASSLQFLLCTCLHVLIAGSLAGGICEKRTTTLIGERNLNTGFTTLLNFGRKVYISVLSSMYVCMYQCMDVCVCVRIY